MNDVVHAPELPKDSRGTVGGARECICEPYLLGIKPPVHQADLLHGHNPQEGGQAKEFGAHLHELFVRLPTEASVQKLRRFLEGCRARMPGGDYNDRIDRPERWLLTNVVR